MTTIQNYFPGSHVQFIHLDTEAYLNEIKLINYVEWYLACSGCSGEDMICFIPGLSHAFHSYFIYLNETCVLILECNKNRPISTYMTIMKHVYFNVV